MLGASHIEMHSAVSLGILLIASLLSGIIADFIRIPKVTAYLLAGILVGPSVLDAISTEHMHHLEPVTKLAMALVLLELGCQFPLAHLRPILKRAVWLSGGELIATFFIVALTVYLYRGSVSAALLLGALALATAPATTVFVFKESNSEGPVTELAGVLVALNNIAAIIGFELIFFIARILSPDIGEASVSQLGRLFLDLGGAVTLGGLSGLVISYSCGLLSRRRWLVMVLAVSVLLLGVCESWSLPYMLAFLSAGVVLVNTSDSTRELMAEQEKITSLLIVVFFAVHGAELKLDAFLAAGVLGMIYIVARCSGKILGIRWASQFRHEAATVRRYLGSCMLAQAGAAIALATVAANRWPGLGEELQAIILGSVVFFEIVGPICIRWSILKAGEVPLAHAIVHRTETATSQAGKMVHQVRDALGMKPPPKADIQTTKVKGLVRRNVTGISQTAEFDEVLNYIRRSHDNTYVVTNEKNQIAGLIRYALLSDTFFDAAIDTLVRAEDLASPSLVRVSLDDTLTKAVEAFRTTTDDIIPVIDSAETAVFVGVLRRGDLTEFAMKVRS